MASFDAIAASLLAEGDDATAVSQLDAVLAPDSAAPSQAARAHGDGDDNGGGDADGGVPELDLDYALSQLCLSESAAPELFQYEDIIVGRARQALRALRRELAHRRRAAAAAATAAEDGTEPAAVDDCALPALSAVVDMERARLRYLLAWYHRLRLEKIEGLLDVLAAEAREPAGDGDGDGGGGGAVRLSARLAPAELQFARDLHRLRVEHLDRAFGAALPAPYRVRDDEACAPRTGDDVRAAWDRTPVFVTIDADVGTVALDDNFEFVHVSLSPCVLFLSLV